MKRRLWWIFAALVLALTQTGGIPAWAEPPQASQWLREFGLVCGDSDAASALDRDILMKLVARCEKLKESIGVEEESVRKVYLRRLQACQDFYRFMLETRRRD